MQQHLATHEENQYEGRGKDFDEESTTQNFMNMARQGDLSPRHMDKVKSVGKGRKKQQKESSSIRNTGVETRRSITKSNN